MDDSGQGIHEKIVRTPQSFTVILLTRPPARTQTTRMDRQQTREKQPGKADYSRLLHFLVVKLDGALMCIRLVTKIELPVMGDKTGFHRSSHRYAL